MNNFERELAKIEPELQALKIARAKMASVLRTTEIDVDVTFTLADTFNTGVPQSNYALITIKNADGSDAVPLVSIRVEEDDLPDGRWVSMSTVPVFNNGIIYGVSAHIISGNADDVAATRDGGTLSIPCRFVITSTAELETALTISG